MQISEPGIPKIGVVNWVGLRTMYAKESRRFLKVWTQTVAAPAVTTLLFMAIFSIALGGANRVSAGVDFPSFLAPGLIMMTIIQNAFQNTQSSILISKVQGNIVDVLMPPLSAGELLVGYVAGAITRGVMVGAAVWLAFYLAPGIDVSIRHPGVTLYYAVSAAVMLGLVGILAGIWAQKFDHAAAINNFLIVPLSLLSGTFYSITRLPETWQAVSRANPFFYLIDGQRYGFLGHADGDVMLGGVIVLALNAVLWGVCYILFRTGYRLKA